MERTDTAIELLQSIRDGVQGTHARLDATNAHLDRLGTELIDRLERVEERQVESEVRLAAAIAAVGRAIGELREMILEDRGLRRTDGDRERRST